MKNVRVDPISGKKILIYLIDEEHLQLLRDLGKSLSREAKVLAE